MAANVVNNAINNCIEQIKKQIQQAKLEIYEQYYNHIMQKDDQYWIQQIEGSVSRQLAQNVPAVAPQPPQPPQTIPVQLSYQHILFWDTHRFDTDCTEEVHAIECSQNGQFTEKKRIPPENAIPNNKVTGNMNNIQLARTTSNLVVNTINPTENLDSKIREQQLGVAQKINGQPLELKKPVNDEKNQIQAIVKQQPLQTVSGGGGGGPLTQDEKIAREALEQKQREEFDREFAKLRHFLARNSETYTYTMTQNIIEQNIAPFRDMIKYFRLTFETAVDPKCFKIIFEHFGKDEKQHSYSSLHVYCQPLTGQQQVQYSIIDCQFYSEMEQEDQRFQTESRQKILKKVVQYWYSYTQKKLENAA